LLINNLFINYLVFQSLIINDTFSLYIKIIVIIFSIFIFFFSINYLKKEYIFNYEYFLILLLSILGLIILVSSYDLISMYLAIELQSLCFYILATFKQYTNFSTEAGIKYFILGAFSSGVLLFGCSILYGFTGVTDFYNLQIIFQNNLLSFNILNSIFIGIIFILVGLFFKMAVAPFHM
jgi:NADH-quinone oxidoreductase subunit N